MNRATLTICTLLLTGCAAQPFATVGVGAYHPVTDTLQVEGYVGHDSMIDNGFSHQDTESVNSLRWEP